MLKVKFEVDGKFEEKLRGVVEIDGIFERILEELKKVFVFWTIGIGVEEVFDFVELGFYKVEIGMYYF